MRGASQCGDHPQGYFSPSGVVAHSSSWSSAAHGHGTLTVEDDGQGDFFQDGDEGRGGRRARDVRRVRPRRLCCDYVAGCCAGGLGCTFAHGEQELHPSSRPGAKAAAVVVQFCSRCSPQPPQPPPGVVFKLVTLFVVAVNRACTNLAVDMNVDGAGAAKRRRERRLRSWWRHERMSIACALAEALHHSLRQPGVRQEEGWSCSARCRTRPDDSHQGTGAGHAVLHFRRRWGRAGSRGSGSFGRRRGICGAARRMSRSLPSMSQRCRWWNSQRKLTRSFENFVPAVAEQVIEVPKLALPGCAVQRAALSEPQTAEQLVDVPTPLYYSLLAVPRRGGGARGGLQGLSQGQGSTAVSGADYVGSTVSGHEGGARGGLQGLSQGQGSAAVSGSVHVNTPVPGRGGGPLGGLQGLSQGQGSTAVCGAQHVDIPVPHGRGGRARGDRHGLSQGQGSSAFCGADHEDTPVPHGRGEGARGGLHGFSSGHQSGQRSAEQNVIPAPSFRSRRARRTAEQNVDIPVRRSRAHGGLQDFSPGQSSSQRTVPGDEDDPPARFGTVLVASGDTGPGVIRADDGQRLRFQLPSWFHIPVGRRVAFRAEEGDGVGTAYGVCCWDD